MTFQYMGVACVQIEDAKAMYKSEEGAKEIISVYGLHGNN